jgi:DNA polymerase-3 subunit alpha
MNSKFTHLHVHSHYSLLDGLAKIEDLVPRAKELGFEALALTDHGSMHGIPEFYKKAKEAGLKPILGLEAYLAPESRFQKRPKIDDKRYHITLLAKNYEGYKNLLQINTKAHLEGFYYKPRIDKELLKEYHEGIIALSGCLTGELAKLILENRLDTVEEKLKEYLDIFHEDFYLELPYHPQIPESAKVKKVLIEIGKKFNVPVVATYDTHYLNPDDAEAHDIMLAVQTGNKTTDEDRLTLKGTDFSLCPTETMEELYADCPEALSNTMKIAELCDVKLDFGKTLLPHFEVPSGDTPESLLEKLCEEGMKKRFGETPAPEVIERLQYELPIIKKTGFASYFLIVQDFVNWAKNNGVVVGPGRGSAAGSLVSYLLNITDVDPIKFDLLFERFLNPERISMPDIDMDFSDTKRDEVIKYLKGKYGEDHVAQIVTFGTMAARAAIRDTGRAIGLAYSFCDNIAKLIPFNTTLKEAVEGVVELQTLYERDADVKKLIDAAKKLEGCARHASIHACGIVITKDALVNYTPLQRAPQDENSIITQYDMYAIEMLGLLKMDLLGLRNLTTMQDALEIIEAVQHVKIDLSALPDKDAKAFKLFQLAETVGVFQLESGGMRRYLKELKPSDIEDIIAMVALYRPGPIEFIPQYIARKHGREKVSYLHPKLEPIMKKTFGVMIYQEQLIKLAIELGGFSIGEADVLRKAVGKKIKELLDQQRDKLINGMITTSGLPKVLAERIWASIEPFAQYGFNRSHAACYARIAYQTAYLKAHYPVEFMAALMNNEATEIERAAALITEAKHMKINVLAPDINESFRKFSVVPEKNSIRFGLQAVKNVGENIVVEIIHERKKNGPFKNVEEFLQRIEHKDLNKKSLESLIKAGAFDNLTERGELLHNLEELLRFNQDSKKAAVNPQVNLFAKEMSFSPLRLKKTEPMPLEEKLRYERELLGLYISDNPLNYKKEIFKKETTRTLAEITDSLIDRGVKVGGIINEIKKIITKTGRAMLIAKIEDLTGNIEITVFPKTLEITSEVWQKDSIVIVEGRVNKNNGELKIICENAKIIK